MRNLDGETIMKFTQYWPFLIFVIVTFVLSFFSIFIYKRRIQQMRICIYNMLVLLAFQGWIAYMYFTRLDGTVFTISAVFPIVAAIFVFMAFRKISEDEALVQGMNSLRDMTKNRKKWKK
jgi:uncharacterized membrane protein YhhN